MAKGKPFPFQKKSGKGKPTGKPFGGGAPAAAPAPPMFKRGGKAKG